MRRAYDTAVDAAITAFFIVFLLFGLVITGAAALDVMLVLGWGYAWKDVLIGGGILLWGCFIYLCCRAVLRLFRSSGL